MPNTEKTLQSSQSDLVPRTLTLSQQQQQSSNYQCFRYERHYSEEKGGIVVKMAQSYSGACEGLWSAEEGDRTYTLWTGKKRYSIFYKYFCVNVSAR